MQQEFDITQVLPLIIYWWITVGNLSSISPIINCLSDHKAQILTTRNIYATINKFPLKQRTKLIENKTTINIQTLLNKETWESIYIDKDPNHLFNSFLPLLKHFPS